MNANWYGSVKFSGIIITKSLKEEKTILNSLLVKTNENFLVEPVHVNCSSSSAVGGRTEINESISHTTSDTLYLDG